MPGWMHEGPHGVRHTKKGILADWHGLTVKRESTASTKQGMHQSLIACIGVSKYHPLKGWAGWHMDIDASVPAGHRTAQRRCIDMKEQSATQRVRPKFPLHVLGVSMWKPHGLGNAESCYHACMCAYKCHKQIRKCHF